MQAPPDEGEQGAKRLSEVELTFVDPSVKSKKQKLSGPAQARYQLLLARLLEQEQARRKTLEEIRTISPSFNISNFLRNPHGTAASNKSANALGDTPQEQVSDMRLKRSQQKELVAVFNRMVTSAATEPERGVEKQKLLEFFQELAPDQATEPISTSVFWKYTRGSKYKATESDANHRLYKTVQRWGVRTLHGVRWNNPRDETDLRRIHENFEALAQLATLCIDRAQVEARLLQLIYEQTLPEAKQAAQQQQQQQQQQLAKSAPESMDEAAATRMLPTDINARPDEERKFTQFFVPQVVDLWKKQQAPARPST